MVDDNNTYLLSPLAEADLENIWLYTFKNWSLEQADSYINDIVTVFEGLTSGDIVGRPVDIRDGYFKYPAGSHMVFYRFSDAGLVVMRVLHGRMDTERHI